MAGNEGADDHLCPGPTSWRHSAGRGHDRGLGRGVTPALTLGGILPCKGLLRIESGPVLRGAIGALGGRTTGGHADGAGLGGLCGGLRPSPATARVLARSWRDLGLRGGAGTSAARRDAAVTRRRARFSTQVDPELIARGPATVVGMAGGGLTWSRCSSRRPRPPTPSGWRRVPRGPAVAPEPGASRFEAADWPTGGDAGEVSCPGPRGRRA